jgi:DNA-binding NarL/FixJ family response regulator
LAAILNFKTQSATSKSGPVEQSVLPRNASRYLRAADDSLGADKRPDRHARILVVEDDFLVAFAVEAALMEAGFAIAGVAATAEEAIAIAVAERPALVLMDVRLASVRDGIDTAIELFRDHNIRCIFASAHADPASRRRGAAANPLGWLQKPYTTDSMIAMVKLVLNAKQS